MTTERRTIYRNLVTFTASRPPWTIFLFSLGVCALGFLILGYYVWHNDNIVDSEATKGWDNLYSNLTSLTFCLNQTATQDNQDTQSFEYQEYKLVNVSLPFQLITTPYQGSVAINVSDLAVAIPYFHFKFGRHILHETKVWINFESNSLFGHCIIDENTSNCRQLTYSACVTISLPSSILPLVRPQLCNVTTNSPHPSKMYTVGRKENDRTMVADCEEKEMQISLSRHNGYSPEVLLSLAEKSHLNLKLQFASYILLVILLSFVLYAAIKGRPLKW